MHVEFSAECVSWECVKYIKPRAHKPADEAMYTSQAGPGDEASIHALLMK